jgi:hypothetical protein
MKDIVTIEQLIIELPLGHEIKAPSSSPRHRDICADPPLVGGSVPDLAGQANAESAGMRQAVEIRAPSSSPRDRDICADPPLVGGLVPDLAGQANAESVGMRQAVNRTNENGITLLYEHYTQNEIRDLLQKIIDGENTDLIDMETHLSNVSDIILMLRESSQLEIREDVMRILDAENIDKHDQEQRLAMDEQSSYDHEMNQMSDDIQYEENAVTDRIIEAFGGLFHDGDNGSSESESIGEDNLNFHVHSITSSEDDINENTDTEDGTEDLIELIGANTRLIAFLAKQRDTLARLRTRISRMKRYIEQLTSRLDELTTSNLHEHDAQTSENIATVLMDAEMDTSLLIKPNRELKSELDFFNNTKVKKELEEKLYSLHGTRASELWMFFDSGASRSVISTESPIRKHLKEIVPAYGSCSVGNGTPLQYIETGKVQDNMEIKVVADLKYDLFSSVNAAKQGLTSIIDYDLKSGKNNSYTIDKITGAVTPLVERGKGILELPLHLMIPRGKCLALTQPTASQQAAISPNIVSMFWHFYDDEQFDPATRENNHTEYSLFTFDIIKSLNERERDFLIHARLGHLPRKTILQMIKNGTTGISDYSGKFKELCKPCFQARQ